MHCPTPELPDDTPIGEVELSTRIRNVLEAAGLKTVGEVREISNEILLSFNDCGKLPSCIFVRRWVSRRQTVSDRDNMMGNRSNWVAYVLCRPEIETRVRC